MTSYLQLTLKNLKTSVRLVANSVLSTKYNYGTIHKKNPENLLFYSQVKRLPSSNNNDTDKMTKLSQWQSCDTIAYQFQFGTKRSNWSSYKENFLNDNKAQSIIRSYSTDSSDKKADVESKVSRRDESVINKENKEVPLNRKEMLKKAMKDYGATVTIFYIGISIISVASIYVLLSSGLDVVAILQRFGLGDSALSNKLAAGASTFVVAYAIHMLFVSVRISITLASAPFIVRFLRNKGIFKKPPGSK